MMRDRVQTVGNLIDKQGICYLGSVDQEGFPNVKAMLRPRRREDIKTIWLSTNTPSMHVAQFRENEKSCIYFCDKRFFRGVMLTGTIAVLEDPDIKEQLWLPDDTMYYPKGVNDPDYCVLRFTARTGRYYCNFHSESFSIDD